MSGHPQRRDDVAVYDTRGGASGKLMWSGTNGQYTSRGSVLFPAIAKKRGAKGKHRGSKKEGGRGVDAGALGAGRSGGSGGIGAGRSGGIADLDVPSTPAQLRGLGGGGSGGGEEPQTV